MSSGFPRRTEDAQVELGMLSFDGTILSLVASTDHQAVRSEIMTSKFLLPVVVLTALGMAAPAKAHMIETNYLLPSPAATITPSGADSSALKITAVFSTGEPYANAKIEIFAPGNSDNPWRVTTADENGEYHFVPDAQQPGNWTINIGEDSHWDSLTVPVQARGEGFSYGTISQARPDRSADAIAIGTAIVLGGFGYWSMRRR